jgi:DNA-binding transcriptional LysR family regulator
MAFDGRLLRGISVLPAVVETGNFVGAAEALGLTQSGIPFDGPELKYRFGRALEKRFSRNVLP